MYINIRTCLYYRPSYLIMTTNQPDGGLATCSSPKERYRHVHNGGNACAFIAFIAKRLSFLIGAHQCVVVGIVYGLLLCTHFNELYTEIDVIKIAKLVHIHYMPTILYTQKDVCVFSSIIPIHNYFTCI